VSAKPISLLALTFALVSAIQFPGNAAEHSSLRTWSDSTGKFRVEAALIDFRDGHVQLEKKDGQTITLALEKLGKADQKYVLELVAKGGDAGTAAGTSQQYTYTNRSTGEAFHGRTVKIEKSDNRRALLVESDDGSQLRIWADEWDITSGAPQERALPAPSPISEKRNTASTPGSAAGASDSRLLTVVCTGIGLSPDEARQNAFASAIEQTMGVLVDAETLVENDEIIRDNVLTFTRGTVKHFQVLSNWQQGDLHYVRIRADVAIDELTARLKDKRITVSKFPGEQIYRQFRFDDDSSQSAADLFAKVMEAYGLDQFAAVEEPKEWEIVRREAGKATLRLAVKVKSDKSRWEVFRSDLRSRLKRIASDSYIYVSDRNKAGARGYYEFQGGGDHRRMSEYESTRAKEPGVWVSVLTAVTPDGHETMQSTWESFRLPALVGPTLHELLAPDWQLRVELLDQQGDRLATAVRDMGSTDWHAQSKHVKSVKQGNFHAGGGKYVDQFWLAPFPWCLGSYAPAFELPDFTIEVPADDLPRIHRVAVFVEKTTEESVGRP